jgi:hypothetical protein
MDKTPTKAGVYWAKGGTCQWHNLIVSITGDAPFLKIDKVMNLMPLSMDSDVTTWGPEIQSPDDGGM